MKSYPVVNLIYRAPSISCSIENVFNEVFDQLSPTLAMKKTFLKYSRANFRSIIGNIKVAQSSQTAINHMTGDAHYTLLGLSDRNCNILTVHDLVTLEYLDGWKREVAKYLWFIMPMKKARFVTAISSKTAKELVDLYPEVEGKIHIIHDPVSSAFKYSPKSKCNEKPRLLHVGTKPNKNLPRVIEALVGMNAILVIIGNLRREDKVLLADRNIDYLNYSGLTNEQVCEQYEKCDIVLFPSLYEGFGLPIVEANAVGRPVITSNIEPMKEIAGDAAILVNPKSTAEIRNAILALLGKAELRMKLNERGLLNVKRFKATLIADQYLSLYMKNFSKKRDAK